MPVGAALLKGRSLSNLRSDWSWPPTVLIVQHAGKPSWWDAVNTNPTA